MPVFDKILLLLVMICFFLMSFGAIIGQTQVMAYGAIIGLGAVIVICVRNVLQCF